ncbi:MAG: hypothetical protein RI907_3981 [Pseudomonadota bacterium]|jgi:DUF1365 family protein
MAHQAQIGFGHVWHQRLRPRHHAFRYPGYFLMLPLRSMRAQPDPHLPRNRRGWLSFHDADHGEGGADALAWFEALLAQEGVRDADGEVWLQTYPRVLGHTFKPVSFWFALRANGELAAVLAEVNNTFGERHGYLLTGPQLAWGEAQQATKVFHVSPFCQATGHYRFRFTQTRTTSGLQHQAQVDLYAAPGDDTPLIQTRQSGRLEALTPATLRRACFGHPLMTLAVVARIHWHALQLWLKRVPFFTKPPASAPFVTR